MPSSVSLKGLLPPTSFAMAKVRKANATPAVAREPLAPLPAFSSPQELQSFLKSKFSKSKIVVGEGSDHPPFLFIGEAPSDADDQSGRPFVGRAGQLLDKMIEAMKVKRSDLYLTHLVKIQPPENRKPSVDEIETFLPVLKAEIALLKPKIIVTLGATATNALLELSGPIENSRGKMHAWNGMKVIPTFHPAFLLKNAAAKKDAWEDLKLVLRELK